jgi:hypothetical protein
VTSKNISNLTLADRRCGSPNRSFEFKRRHAQPSSVEATIAHAALPCQNNSDEAARLFFREGEVWWVRLGKNIRYETDGDTASSTPDTPPVFEINGKNPAYLKIGDTYNDLGATICPTRAALSASANARCAAG